LCLYKVLAKILLNKDSTKKVYNMKTVLFLCGLIILVSQSYAQSYPNNEDYQYQDLLTPEYYDTPNGGSSFRDEVNKYVFFARQMPFQHPFTDASGNTPTIFVTREFGDIIGQPGNTEYHNARDMKVVASNDTTVALFASIDGVVNIYRDAIKYRDYLTITQNVEDSLGSFLGKIVVLYGHLDLNLDSLDNRNLDGQYINQGDTISNHLYSGTAGSPHLHFEIRYYRNEDNGTESYYGKPNGFPNFTDPSSGPWSHGEWDPNFGYGFADPVNHLNQVPVAIITNELAENIKCYPNPTKDMVTVELNEMKELSYSIYNLNGQIIKQNHVGFSNKMKIDLDHLTSGIYLISLSDGKNRASIRVVKE